MDDSTIDGLPHDKLVFYVKKLRDAANSLKSERDSQTEVAEAAEKKCQIVASKAKDVVATLKETKVQLDKANTIIKEN